MRWNKLFYPGSAEGQYCSSLTPVPLVVTWERRRLRRKSDDDFTGRRCYVTWQTFAGAAINVRRLATDE